MPDKFVYLFLDLSAIAVPLAFSFYPKAHFFSTYRRILPSLLLPLPLFIAWDALFTHLGVWGFNERYVIGVNYLNLPLEEWLFFLAIPYASLFTYFAIKHLKPIQVQNFHLFGYFLGYLFVFIGCLHLDKLYTSVTFISLGMVFLFLGYTKKPYLPQFLLSYILVLIPFFIINGVLTGSWLSEPVVWYNDQENLGIRLGTIPIEDAFYGMLLLLLNTAIWEETKK